MGPWPRSPRWRGQEWGPWNGPAWELAGSWVRGGRRPEGGSQVDLALGRLGRCRCGCGWEVRGLGQGDFLQGGRVLAGVMATVGEGTVGGQEAHRGRFGVPVFWGAGAADASRLLPSSVLVRHEGGEFEGAALGPAAGGRLARHPARVRVTKLAALPGTCARHGNIRQRAQVCRRQREDGHQAGRPRKAPLHGLLPGCLGTGVHTPSCPLSSEAHAPSNRHTYSHHPPHTHFLTHSRSILK